MPRAWTSCRRSGSATRWTWSIDAPRPELLRRSEGTTLAIELDDPTYGRRWLYCDGNPSLLFTDNETNRHADGPSACSLLEDTHSLLVTGVG
jgi:hypothetical protein